MKEIDFKTQYQEALGHITLPPACQKEVIQMKQSRKPKRFLARRALVALAALTALFGTTVAADAATGGQLSQKVRIFFDFAPNGVDATMTPQEDGSYRIHMPEANEEEIILYTPDSENIGTP